jgi:hypothetical protein
MFYGLMTAGMFLAAWLPRIQSASYENSLMSAHAAICIACGIGVHQVMAYARRWPTHDQLLAGIGVYVLCLLQFGALFYSPRKQIPTDRDLKAGRDLVAQLQQIPGRLFMPYHSGCYVPELFDRCASAQQMAIQDVLRFGSDGAKAMLESDYRNAIEEKRFSAIVLDAGGSYFQEEFEKHYDKRQLELGGPDVLWTLTGYRTSPRLILSHARKP